MSANTSIRMGNHYNQMVDTMIKDGRFESKSEAVRAALRLLEQYEEKRLALKQTLAVGIDELDKGKGISGATFMDKLIQSYE